MAPSAGKGGAVPRFSVGGAHLQDIWTALLSGATAACSMSDIKIPHHFLITKTPRRTKLSGPSWSMKPAPTLGKSCFSVYPDERRAASSLRQHRSVSGSGSGQCRDTEDSSEMGGGWTHGTLVRRSALHPAEHLHTEAGTGGGGKAEG